MSNLSELLGNRSVPSQVVTLTRQERLFPLGAYIPALGSPVDWLNPGCMVYGLSQVLQVIASDDGSHSGSRMTHQAQVGSGSVITQE